MSTSAAETTATTTAAPVATTVPGTEVSETTAAVADTTEAAPEETTTTTTTEPPQLLGLEVVPFAEIEFPLTITAPSRDPRLFVGQRDGIVRIVDGSGTVVDRPFLDISDVVKAGGVEQGFLGMAFHPEYPENGRFFVYYTDVNDDTILAEYRVSGDPGLAEPGTARQILFIDQPTDRHNAGMLQFGPEGYLYVAVGDGGDGGHNGQKTDTVLGTILRIDVDSGDPYAIPADNPFVSGGGAPEVWLYGLRNPWRFSIDYSSELIYIGDVGQADREEVDVLPLTAGGANLGWVYMEGTMCFRAPECNDTETVLPIHEYSHDDGCSITGGIVYRGEAIPEYDGTYFYADWCRNNLRSLKVVDGEATEHETWEELAPGQVNTFGADALGELYMGTWDGMVWKLVPVRADS
jgi:glucose/arabinose dehydrogenase